MNTLQMVMMDIIISNSNYFQNAPPKAEVPEKYFISPSLLHARKRFIENSQYHDPLFFISQFSNPHPSPPGSGQNVRSLVRARLLAVKLSRISVSVLSSDFAKLVIAIPLVLLLLSPYY